MDGEKLEKIEVRMPISVELGVRKKRKYYLNLNLYRNNNHHINNNVKQKYAEIAHNKLPMIIEEPWSEFEIEYTLFLPNKLKRDIANVLSVVDKAFCDALVTHNIVVDDNYNHLKLVTYKYGGQDVDGEGYVDIVITNLS